MHKRFLTVLTVMVLVALISCRIWYVNKNARLPVYETYKQDESVECGGLRYTVTDAYMMGYDDFFRKNPEYIKYYEDTILDRNGRKVLLVNYKVEMLSDAPKETDIYIPVVYAYAFNGFDPFLFNDMNPTLAQRGLKSGDKITIMYEIYEELLSEKQWQQVQNLDYRMVFGVYPVRKEIILTDIEYR